MSVYLVTSEYDDQMMVVSAYGPQHAIELGREAGLVGTLNAVFVE